MNTPNMRSTSNAIYAQFYGAIVCYEDDKVTTVNPV